MRFDDWSNTNAKRLRECLKVLGWATRRQPWPIWLAQLLGEGGDGGEDNGDDEDGGETGKRTKQLRTKQLRQRREPRLSG